MAFRTNKMPVLQTKSASGAVATFNTALAMPLVECKVSFLATQSGSGTPSPDNTRPFVPVSAINLNVNGTAISKSLSGNRYGGWLNLLTGEGQITHSRVNLGDRSWTTLSSGRHRTSIPDMYHYSSTTADGMCTNYQPVNNEDVQIVDYSFSAYTASDDSRYVQINDSDLNGVSSTAFTQAMRGVYFVYQLETPFGFQLTPEQISTIIGNNTIFADTGDIDLTYKDLDIAKYGSFREVFKLPS